MTEPDACCKTCSHLVRNEKCSDPNFMLCTNKMEYIREPGKTCCTDYAIAHMYKYDEKLYGLTQQLNRLQVSGPLTLGDPKEELAEAIDNSTDTLGMLNELVVWSDPFATDGGS